MGIVTVPSCMTFSFNHVQTNDKIKGVQVDDLNRHHRFKIATNRHRDLDRTHGKLITVITFFNVTHLSEGLKPNLSTKSDLLPKVAVTPQSEKA
jgi:hypothetical protein